ncbi:MAG TPA: bacteriocin [Ktedonobacterales bacterium]|jgi:bacteriocin-like protein
MANKDKKNEKKQPENTPATQAELNDEELEQIVGGFNPQPDPPGVRADPPGPDAVGPTI